MPSTVIPALVAASLLLITPAVAALGLRGEGESPIASQRSIHRYNFPVDVAAEARCSGTMELAGVGTVHIINSPGGNVLKEGNGVTIPVNSRMYIGSSCDAASDDYAISEYLEIFALGKEVSWTMDLSELGCRCAGTIYLIPMTKNTGGARPDFYCDAAAAAKGGVFENCAELDMQEANSMAVHAVLHTAYDRDGVNGGYGGGDPSAYNGPRDFTGEQYGLGGSCIDTNFPFRVAASFPVDGSSGRLTHMKVTYTQGGCTLQTRNIGEGDYNNAEMAELTSVLEGGVTPVLSHWSNGDMLWLSGKGQDGLGGCSVADIEASTCGEAKFYNIALTEIGEGSLIPLEPSPTSEPGPPVPVPTQQPSVPPPTPQPSVPPPTPEPVAQPTPSPTPCPEMTEGVCCFWSNSGDPCACNSPATPGSYCSQSETRCNSCGGAVGWCPGATPECADDGDAPDPVPAPTNAPLLVPTTTPTNGPAVTVSVSTCDDLGWTNGATYGSSAVCGESNRNLGGCGRDLSWSEARDFCESAGARLCSAAELHANEARSTGCGFDRAQLWTADACDGGFLLAMGASFAGLETECASSADSKGVRCCADTVASPASTRLLRGLAI